MKAVLTVMAVLALTTGSAVAASSPPAFRDGPQVARALERHFASADYQRRLARSGAKITRRVLCTYVARRVQCSGQLQTQGLNVQASWTLTKITTQRARLSWRFRTVGVTQRDSMLIAPRELGLRRF